MKGLPDMYMKTIEIQICPGSKPLLARDVYEKEASYRCESVMVLM